MIRLARPDISDGDMDAVAGVLETGHLVQGERVADFERAVASYCDGGEVIAVCNGTAALHLALLSIGVGPGDHVGVPTYSWPATANVIVLCGARPVFIDIESETFGMDPAALEMTLVRGPRPRALLPVHAFGAMADMPAIMRLADAHDVPVIEDAACALGSTLGGRAAGSWGRLGCFSFHPRKAATTGEGGAIRSSDPVLTRTLRSLRNHGQDPESPVPDFVTAGFNARLTEFQAALGVSQLERYGTLLRARRQRARLYDTMLAGLPVETPRSREPEAHNYQSYVVLLDERAAFRRSTIIANLRQKGIETNIGTYHLPLLTYYRRAFGHEPGEYPVGEDIAARALALPMSASLTEDEQTMVVEALGRELCG